MIGKFALLVGFLLLGVILAKVIEVFAGLVYALTFALLYAPLGMLIYSEERN